MEITGEITTEEIPSGMYGTFCMPAGRQVLESSRLTLKQNFINLGH